MAVYTKFGTDDFKEILSHYSLGELKSFEGIKEGIENTNYKIKVDNKEYILTVYEKRVKTGDLPFFANLMESLNKSGIKCPRPIKNTKHQNLSDYKNKKLMIVTYLEGKQKNSLTPSDCYLVGKEVANFHEKTKLFSFRRNNDLSINSWRKIFNQVKDNCSSIHKDLPNIIENNLREIENNWPTKLPSGIIHADLFSDNIFFHQQKFAGFIDFYFACNDFYAFEIAICFNALCFDGNSSNLSFNVTKAKNFINGYESVRKISEEEKNFIKVLSQGAALRFLLTRVFDYLNIVEGALVKVKDPVEYLKRLEFHNSAKNFEDYFF